MPKVSVPDEVKAIVTAEGEDEERQFVEKETKKESKGRNDRGGGSYYQLSRRVLTEWLKMIVGLTGWTRRLRC